jgi:hypothetical protein
MRYRFLAIGLGLLAGIVMIVIMESVSGVMYPMPESVNPGDLEAVNTYLKNEAPMEGYIMILLGYLLGAFAGGFTACWFEKLETQRMNSALITGAILMAFGLMNLFMIYHPTWFWAASLAVYLLAAWLGGKLALGIKK